MPSTGRGAGSPTWPAPSVITSVPSVTTETNVAASSEMSRGVVRDVGRCAKMTQQGPVGRRFYGIAEIAEALGVDRQLATVWRRRSSHGIPRPDDELAAGPLWLAETIEPWIRVTRARLQAERGGQAVTLDLLRTVTRRMLRLAALLLEEAPRVPEIRTAAAAVQKLSASLPARPAHGAGTDSNVTWQLLTEVVEYVVDLDRWSASAGAAQPAPDDL